MTQFETRLETAKAVSMSHLLIKCARLLNERAVASLPGPSEERPRTAHLALFPHISLDTGTRVTELAVKLGISKQAVGQLVDDLERFTYVERVSDPDDKRAKLVRFTQQGRAAMLEGLEHLQQIDGELERDMGPKTVKALHHCLTQLLEALNSDTK